MSAFTFRAFQATNNLYGCERFHKGHSKILEDLGIVNLTSNKPTWFDDPDVVVIEAEDSNGDLIGGIRVHKYKSGFEIPLIQAIEFQDPNIRLFFEHNLSNGIAESCGLWNDRKVFGRGISPLLARASVALSYSMGVELLTCFSAPYTFKMISSLGFIPVLEIGDGGKLPYPSEKFISTVLHIPDMRSLEFADEIQRERIFSLKENPIQKHTELSQNKEIEINYNLSW